MKYYKELITIGIPAFNEEKYIRKTIESCINQAACVIVSDNASTDNTQKICEELAQKYPNLQYVRQPRNIGGTNNFNFVLNAAKTKYFMWMGGHDFIDEAYTQNAIHMLECSDASGCYPTARYVDNDDEVIGMFDCWFSERLVSDYASTRVYTLISHLHEVSGLFGVFHTKLAQQYPLKAMLGNDHVFLCNMALRGRLVSSPRSIYNWRQTKMHLSREENIKVWEKSLGDKENEVKPSCKDMQKEQVEILKKAGLRGYGFFSKLRLISKAKKKLKKRFGD
jgi:glycosyltransferase involved in cell wall biosynthesis